MNTILSNSIMWMWIENYTEHSLTTLKNLENYPTFCAKFVMQHLQIIKSFKHSKWKGLNTEGLFFFLVFHRIAQNAQNTPGFSRNSHILQLGKYSIFTYSKIKTFWSVKMMQNRRKKINFISGGKWMVWSMDAMKWG